MLLSKYWSDITQISHSSLGDNGPENKKDDPKKCQTQQNKNCNVIYKMISNPQNGTFIYFWMNMINF